MKNDLGLCKKVDLYIYNENNKIYFQLDRIKNHIKICDVCKNSLKDYIDKNEDLKKEQFFINFFIQKFF